MLTASAEAENLNPVFTIVNKLKNVGKSDTGGIKPSCNFKKTWYPVKAVKKGPLMGKTGETQ